MIDVGIHREDDNGDIITLKQRWGLRIKWNGREFIIPRYFHSDGCSVPRIFWDSISPAINPKTLRAALAHDYIYRTHPEGWTKADADQMFYDLMVADGFPKFRAWIAYTAVKLFGGHAWRTRGGVAA